MRKSLKLVSQIALVAVIFVALTASTCTTGYKTAAGIQTAVELSMNTYGEFYRAGLVTPDLELKVKTIYKSYQLAAAAVAEIGKEVATLEAVKELTPDQKTALTNARDRQKAALQHLQVLASDLSSTISQLQKNK